MALEQYPTPISASLLTEIIDCLFESSEPYFITLTHTFDGEFLKVLDGNNFPILIGIVLNTNKEGEPSDYIVSSRNQLIYSCLAIINTRRVIAAHCRIED